MSKKSLLRNNSIVVVIAFFLSFAVYSLATNYSDVATNIQWAVQGDEVTADLRVSVEESVLVVTTQKDIDWVVAVSILALYDTETVNWSDDWVTTPYSATVSSNEPWEISIVLDMHGPVSLQAGDELARIAINGDPFAVSFWDIALTFDDGVAQSVSVEVP